MLNVVSLLIPVFPPPVLGMTVTALSGPDPPCGRTVGAITGL